MYLCLALLLQSQSLVPSLLDYSYLSNILEFGDVVEYKLRSRIHQPMSSVLMKTATVTAIRLEADNVTKSVLLSNGDKLIGSLHMVRRISMRSLDSRKTLWNPIRTWKELHNIHLEPTEHVNIPDNDAVNVSSAIGNTPTEMDHPSLVDPSPMASTNVQRWVDKRRSADRTKHLLSTRISKSGRYLGWLAYDKRLEEIQELEVLYQRCLSTRAISDFRLLINTTTNDDYVREKRNLKRKVASREKGWVMFNVAFPISLFSNIKSKEMCGGDNVQPSPGTPAPNCCLDPYESEIGQIFMEKTIEFEDDMSSLRIQFCPSCRENHLIDLPKPKAKRLVAYECEKCKSLDDNYYLKNNLNPVWFERIPGAKDHTEFKLDSNGKKIVRYDQPTELTSLTMAEQLLIRRCAPFIPALHLHAGYMAIKGHGVAFQQDIDEMCNILPQTKKTSLTFMRQMGNKDTKDVHLTSLRVRRNKVLSALEWLKLHHIDYHNIKIAPQNLNWMGNSKVSYLKGPRCNLQVTDKNEPKGNPFVSRVQCLIDEEDVNDIPFHMLSESNSHHIPNAAQSKPILELSESVPKDQKDKLLMFPPHGDKPVK